MDTTRFGRFFEPVETETLESSRGPLLLQRPERDEDDADPKRELDITLAKQPLSLLPVPPSSLSSSRCSLKNAHQPLLCPQPPSSPFLLLYSFLSLLPLSPQPHSNGAIFSDPSRSSSGSPDNNSATFLPRHAGDPASC
jgi:hypothetical protein